MNVNDKEFENNAMYHWMEYGMIEDQIILNELNDKRVTYK